VKVPGEAPRLDHPAVAPRFSEVQIMELNRLLLLEEEYEQKKVEWKDAEEMYDQRITQLVEKADTIQETLEITTKSLEQISEQLLRHQIFENALRDFLKPLIPEASVKVDEKVIERLIDKKIAALPARKRQKVEPEGETGIPWVDMWLPKLKTKAERRIVTLLAEKIGTPLTKTQIALALAYSEKGGSFNSALNNLKRRYKLVIQDGDTYRIAEAPT
jgi:hypothetical protein